MLAAFAVGIEMVNNKEIETRRLKREILVRLVRAFDSDNFGENTRLIPYDMRPKRCDVSFRCCVHKERAVLRMRLIAGLGGTLEQDSERELLSDYAAQALARTEADQYPLTVLESACQGCPGSRVYVTDLCQGCVARSCTSSCKFGAIEIKDGRSVIDPDKCKKCGLCLKACPYQAIIKTIVPCENACPVDAIAKDESGYARIDFDKCISCGKCVSSCPFGAIHAKSQLIDVLNKIKQGRQVIALMAPALVGHMDAPPEKVHSALKKIGFSKVYEVAQGADITAKNESHELKKRLEEGQAFMTTSCCAAYNELVKRHLTELAPFVSDTKTPLYYIAEIARKEHPDAVTVFLSPCFAKRKEVVQNPNVDYVLNFEELAAILMARDIDLENCAEEKFAVSASKEAREFPLTGGVARSVQAAFEGDVALVKSVLVNGLNKESIRELKRFAKCGACEGGNLIEVMSCEGGCIAGNAALNPFKDAFKKVSDYGARSDSIKK